MKSAVCVERVPGEDIARVLRLRRELVHALRALFDKRIEVSRGFPEELHSERVPLRGILHLTERVDNLPIDRLGVPEIALRVRDRNTELLVCLGIRGAPVAGGVHALEVFRHGARERLYGNVEEVGGVHIRLELIGCYSRDRGGRQNLVGVCRARNRHIDELGGDFPGSRRKRGNCRRRRCPERRYGRLDRLEFLSGFLGLLARLFDLFPVLVDGLGAPVGACLRLFEIAVVFVDFPVEAV